MIRNPVTAMLAVATIASLSSPAFAWKHTDPRVVWAPDEMPIQVRVADDGATNTPEACEKSGGLSGCCEETVPAGYCYEATRRGFEEWAKTPCTDIRVDVIDGVSDPSRAAANEYDLGDGVNAVVFNGAQNAFDNANPSTAGAIAFTAFREDRQQIAAIINGETYYRHLGDVDIVFNNSSTFTTDEEIEAGRCNGELNIQETMTHEIGHFLGMGHSCDQDEPCPDPVLADATMYWQSRGPCNRSRVDINEDDIQGITALYGPSARFSCSHQADEDQVIGVVPFELKCVIYSDFISEITEATWVFGDGGVSDELAAAHTYKEPGNYTIQVSVRGENEQCGEAGWRNEFRRVGYVRACGIPDAAFEVEKVDGLSYQMLNDSDVSVFGCISDIQWDVFEGEGTSGARVGEPVKAWDPVIDFPEPGTYTVVMSLGGIAGTGGAMATFEVDRSAKTSVFGCNSTAPAGGAAASLALIGLLLLRRRR